jgi:hypothetical protein
MLRTKFSPSTHKGPFVSLIGGAAALVSLIAHAADPPIAQRAQAGAATLPHIRTVQVKPLEPPASNYRFWLRDGDVDLMKGFSLSSEQGIGASWQGPLVIPPASDATFEERFGDW